MPVIRTYYVIIPQILHSILYITTILTHTHIQYTLHGRDSEPMLALLHTTDLVGS